MERLKAFSVEKLTLDGTKVHTLTILSASTASTANTACSCVSSTRYWDLLLHSNILLKGLIYYITICILLIYPVLV